MNLATTLPELLQQRATIDGDKECFLYLEQGEVVTQRITFSQLEAQSRELAGYLQSRYKKGRKILLLLPNSMDFVVGFFGCIYGGFIPIPANPPRLNKPPSRLISILENSQVKVVLTTEEYYSNITKRLDQAPNLSTLDWVDISIALGNNMGAKWRMPKLDKDSLAFLQYTSGSTLSPRGVMISHENALHNLKLLYDCWDKTHTAILTVANWVPVYHDMGLILGVILPVYAGGSALFMDPIAFLQKPVRWLQTISKFNVTVSGGPNFSFDLCVNKINQEEMTGIDLSNWQAAFNSAEPIQMETIRRFSAKFNPYGFNPTAFFPSYGLAESTLIATGSFLQGESHSLKLNRSALEHNSVEEAEDYTTSEELIEITSSGVPIMDTEIAIVDAETKLRLPEYTIGEIWLSSPSVALGYWNDKDESETVFGAKINGEESREFMISGDLGFMVDDHLYVVGRSKDKIIINGRNFYPQDIESVAQKSHTALEPNGGIAFYIVLDNKEQLVIVQEVKRTERNNIDGKKVINNLKVAVAKYIGLRAHAIVLISPMSLPRTSSGKLQRGKCREMYSNDKLNVLYKWEAKLN